MLRWVIGSSSHWVAFGTPTYEYIMNFTHFFIDRPVFASVLSIVIVLVGAIAYIQLPISQYPPVALPTIVVSAPFPGAPPQVIAETVATPLEQQINGVEDMLYMESQSTANGGLTLTITFKAGTDLDRAQVLVQNRVAVALPQLPTEVRQIGVTTLKRSPDLLLVAHLYSPKGTHDQLYVTNYATTPIRDTLLRIEGVGDITIFGARQYAMRIWLDAGKLAAVNLTAADVVQALRQQNVQVAAGIIGQPPLGNPTSLQVPVTTLGRLQKPEQFEEIIVKSGENDRLVRVRDVARVELGAMDYSQNSYLDGQVAVGLGIFQLPGSNAVATSHRVIAKIKELSKAFPPGLEYTIAHNPTLFVEESITEVYRTLAEASLLVTLIIFIFLQSWRATIIPLLAIPVSLIGTFAVMWALNFSLNNLSLFGLVLAIGIVVDDAIVVVENVERNMEAGLSPRAATHKAMDEVGSAVVSTALVLSSVFIPTAFLGGISGQFYRQFALTIAVSTIISAFVSLTLSPAVAALLLKPKTNSKTGLSRISNVLFGWFFRGFNRVFERSASLYSAVVARIVRSIGIGLVVYVALIGLTYYSFTQVPFGFVPSQDQGYLIISLELPSGASLYRTNDVTLAATKIAVATPGVAHTVSVVGYSGATRTQSSNAAAIFTPLQNSAARAKKGLTADEIVMDLRRRMSHIQDANIVVIKPPPIPGIGTGGGFRLQVEDRSGADYQRLESAATALVAAANKEPGLFQVYSMFRANTPQLYLDIDRTKAAMLHVPLENVFDTLQVYLGSIYVNDFNFLGRTYRVTAQADADFRNSRRDISQLKTRSSTGAIVPLGSLVRVEDQSQPDRITHFNLYPAADVSGSTVPGFSSGQAIAVMERLASEILPPGMAFEWTDLAYQERLAGNVALFIFPLCVLFVFLTLSAQYESWALPFAVILIVPLCLLFAIAGVWLRGMDNNILTQIGFVVLVGLACKNAILIVQFATVAERSGKSAHTAVVEASRHRLRPILMTSFAFILGVLPLVVSTGAGYEMRQVVGTAVFSGMLGVSFFGLFFTPIFYVALSRFTTVRSKEATSPENTSVELG